MISGYVTVEDALIRLKEYRKVLGLDQTKFATILGMSQASYSEIENGKYLLSYNALNEIYHFNCDIDYLLLGKRNRCDNNLLTDLLKACKEDEVKKLYIMIITGFLEFWDWNYGVLWEECLYSELRAMKLLLLNHASYEMKLYYLRAVNKLSQQEFSNVIGIGRTKCGNCENGRSGLDIESILHLYNAGYSLPSFYFETYAGIDGIAYLLEQDSEKKRKFYDYICNVLTNIIENDKAWSVLQKSGVI